MSFLRPHASSDPSPSAANPPLDTTSNDLTHRRFSSVSQTPSPPVSIPTSRPTSDPLPKSSNQLIDAIQSPEPNRRMYYIAQTYSKPISTSSSRPISTYSTYSSDGDAESSLDMDPAPDTQKITTPRLVRRSTRPLSISFNPSNIPKIPEERRKPSPEPGKDDQPEQQHCPCCRHNSIQKPTTYVDASIQTDPEPLRITTTGVSRATNSNLSSALDTDTPLTDDELPLPPPAPNPVIMGRMFDYFSNPGYQLGDSLMSSYHFNYYPQKQAIYSGDAFYVG